MEVLVTVWDGGGTVPVELGVARRLVTAGLDVTVLADPPLADSVERTGARFSPWRAAPHRSHPDDPDVVQDGDCRNPLQVLDRLLTRLATGPAAAFAADVGTQLRSRPADLVVSDGVLFGALAAAEAAGVPAVALCPNVYPRPAPDLPPFGSGLAPAAGAPGRVRDRAACALATRLWDRGLPALNAARARLGLDALSGVWQQWDRAARVLVLTSAAFDLPFAAPANVRYAGPVLDDPDWAAPADPPAGDAPLVLVGMSSAPVPGTADLLRRIVTALAGLPVRGLVSTGPRLDPGEVPGAPRVRVVRSVPHALVLPEADVVVTHAGHGTLLKALAAGVPALCLPEGRDQRDNAVRATRHGAALRLPVGTRPARLAAAVQRLIDDPAFRAAASRLGARLREDAAPSRLVGELEAAAARTAPPEHHHPPTRGDPP